MQTSNNKKYRYSNYEKIAITGIGIVSSIGNNIGDFEIALKNGKSGIGFLSECVTEKMMPIIGAEVLESELDDAIATRKMVNPSKVKKLLRRASKSIKGSVIATDEAWHCANLDSKTVNPNRIGIVVAGCNINTYNSYNLANKHRDDIEFVHPRHALEYMDTYQVGVLSELYGIEGEGMNVGGASASGNIAIIKAAQVLQLGIVDVCIVVGAMAELSPIELQAFINIGAYGGESFMETPQKACRPFDKKHEGFILGQGSGCIILESLTSAKNRNVTVLATLEGAAYVLDGNSQSNPSIDGEKKAMIEAMNSAGIKPQTIDNVNAHGTSTPLGDITELNAIKDVFGIEHCKNNLKVNSTKSLVGHCLYSAGVIEVIATILQLRGGFLHPQINLENQVVEGILLVNKEVEYKKMDYAISNSYGFFGINSSVVLRKGMENKDESWN